jgi:hypothetical protein
MDRSIKWLINAITKFQAKENEVIIIKVERYITMIEADRLIRVMKKYFPQTQALMLPEETDLESVDEAAMNRAGWYRKPKP